MSISGYIKKDIETMIRSNDPLSVRLSLVDLSKHYGVSITPVREAINRLVDEEYIIKLPNRRLRVNPEKSGIGPSMHDVDLPPTPSDWDETLLEEVMLASLRQRAVYLREELISQKFDVGRSIIRHTFSRFAGAGLLEHVPRHGWLVHPFREEEMKAYLAVREVLELKALELARPRIVRSEVNEVLAGSPLPSGTGTASYHLGNEVNKYIIDKSGNRYIRDYFRQYVARYYADLFDFAAPETAVVTEMAMQHRKILEALAGRAWVRAAEELSRHIWAQEQVLKKLLAHGVDESKTV